MANTLENLVPTNKIPPSSEKEDQNDIHNQYAEDHDEEEETVLVTSYYSLCGDCLQGLIPSRWCTTHKWRRRSDSAGPCSDLLRQKEEEEDQVAAMGADDDDQVMSWLVKKVKKVKKASELLAGPKWKNFIRRFGRSCNGIIRNKKRRVQFHYDPQSYALNFDNAIDREADYGTHTLNKG